MTKPKKRWRGGLVTTKSNNCIACGTELGIPGGMGKTGLCGPCCTGEAATLAEFGETW